MIFLSISSLCALLTASLLVVILGFIFLKGLPSMTPYYLFTPESETPGFNQGIANAIAGTIILSFFSITIATPLAVAVAIYLAEYAADGWFTKALRFMIDLLAGMPSIVLGIVGFMILVFSLKYFTGGFSLIAGSVALALLVLPTIERAAEEALKTCPRSLREGSMTLGATRWDTIRRIVVPYSLPGIITGVVLGIGRAAEESAVVVLTAGYTQFMPRFGLFSKPDIFMGTKLVPFQEGIASLPIAVYHTYEFSNMVPIENGFATATVIIVIVMVINLVAKYIAWRYRIGK